MDTRLPEDLSIFQNTHDLRLPDWGPYSKRYAGISHITDKKKGLRFDISVFPGLYRRSVNIPNVNFEGSYFPWQSDAELKNYTFRHELIWKDRLYTDITFRQGPNGPSTRLIDVTCVNNTLQQQNIVLHMLAYMNTFEKHAQYPVKGTCKPVISKSARQGEARGWMILTYPSIDVSYGLAWRCSAAFQIREYQCNDLDTYFRYKVNDHVSATLDDGREEQTHYTDLFLRPVFLMPHKTKQAQAMVCSGTEQELTKQLEDYLGRTEANGVTLPPQHPKKADSSPGQKPFALGQQLMQATLYTNVVFPAKARGQNVRHSTPGKWWDSLYTWDSGFIGLGYTDLDINRAIDNLNAYVTEPGDPDEAFIHHGTPLPVQLYLYQQIWNKTRSKDLLDFFYPRVRQFYEYLAGRSHNSTFANMKSGLLRSWDIFYNSGGWDDYPPQHFMGTDKTLQQKLTPVCTTAHCIRAAKILRTAASLLDAAAYDADINRYTKDIERLAAALQKHSWDNGAGYYGYVLHDKDRAPQEIFRYKDGTNFNMGMDGVTPLVSGFCIQDQTDRLIANLMTEGRMWTKHGLSTVDQRAPYYRKDGYWNGAIWMPHQYFFWRALLDCGHTLDALRIAQTALALWQRETSSTYLCFEHFLVETGRGGGWHHFGGLSAPVVNWFASLYTPGTLTGGYNLWVTKEKFSKNKDGFNGTVLLEPARGSKEAAMLICLKQGPEYRTYIDGSEIKTQEPMPGLIELRLPYTAEARHITITIRA